MNRMVGSDGHESTWHLICPGGGIGRHARLRTSCFRACGFKSCSGHQEERYET
jgi:hypothetical protein